MNSALDQIRYQASQATPESNLENRAAMIARRQARSRQERDGIMIGGGVGFNSTFRSQQDMQMASRQTQYDQLSPQDRNEQEAWAQTQLGQNSGRCPQRYEWIRQSGGYRCGGGTHFVTDALLAEGKGRYYKPNVVKGVKTTLRLQDGSSWSGPFPVQESDDRMTVRLDQGYGQAAQGRQGGERPLLGGRRSVR